VLVKELQGLGLKVDLIRSNKAVDAEAILSSNIHKEATEGTLPEVPQEVASDVDVTEELAADEFSIVDVDGNLNIQGEESTPAMVTEGEANVTEEVNDEEIA